MAGTVKRGKIGSRSLNKILGNAVAAGTSAGGAVAHESTGAVKRTVLTFDQDAFALNDEAGVVAYAGKKIYDFPEGSIVILGAVANLAVSKSSAGVNNDFDGDFALGTATAGGDATLTSTEANIIASTATPQAVSGATTAKGRSTAAVFLDGTSSAADLYLNFLVDDADHDVTTTPANLLVSGSVTLLWAPVGDY